MTKSTFEYDYLYRDPYLHKLTNHLMKDGKKSVAERIISNTLFEIKKMTNLDPILVFHTAIENVKPSVQVKTLRVAGSTYQVPIEISSEKQLFYAVQWILHSSRARKERSMFLKLAFEILDAFKNKGAAVEKKETVHKMAEANRAFVYYRW
uniref:Ribosomal protein S7 n=1 Tax=Jakoba bahamiensis TaxID=221721 RepID=M4Q9Q0_9EUKA|nr:ribosomal protein S7 [Jakoba bahamiensis]AGH24147.1 ribosomal protein S7 [Jakoba bahamiensis]